MTNKEKLAREGYKLVTRREFELAADRPLGLFDRFEGCTIPPGAFVVYDPNDDEDGWLLIDNDPEWLAAQTVESRIEP